MTASPTDQERFRALYELHLPAITAYFVRRIGNQDSADAADDVFTVAWRRLGDVPEGDDSLPWLYGVARNVLANRRRSTRRGGRLLTRLRGMRTPDAPGPEPLTLQRLDDQQVAGALSSLRRADQELVLLSYWEGLTHEQIGRVLGCSKSAVDARMHRVLDRMRKAIRPAGHEPGEETESVSAVEEEAW